MVDNMYESDAPFNMAVATLMRLDAILQQIRTLDYRFPFDSAEKQKLYLGFAKNFYINAVPLLTESEAEKFDYVLDFDITYKVKIMNGNQKFNPCYDKRLDSKLNKYLVKIQQALRKYFMPKGKNLGRAVANID